MGMILMIAIAVGGAIGLIVTIAGIIVATIVSASLTRHRRCVWPTMLVVAGVGTLVAAAIVALYPYPTGQPGSDYDIAMLNWFLQGLGYCASLGIGCVIASIAVFFCPRSETAVST